MSTRGVTRVEVARLRLPLDVDTVTALAQLMENEYPFGTRAHSEPDPSGIQWLVITAEVDL